MAGGGACWRHDYEHREYICTCSPPVAGDTGWDEPPTVHVTELMVLPAGVSLDDAEAREFGLKVTWRGEFRGRSGGGWSVEHIGYSLSRAGNWGYPSRFQRWQYRWETQQEAVVAASAAVDSVRINGRTRKQWIEYRAMQEASRG